jgi:hypothetical protein
MATLKTGLTANLSLTTDSLYNNVTGTGAGPIAFDESNLITVDQKKNEITKFIELRLGGQIVDIEADKEHYDEGIKQALIRYRQHAQGATEESYAFLDLLPETQEYILPREIENVRAIYRRGIGSISGSTASQFEPFAAGYLNTYMMVAGRVGGLVNYELFAGYQELAMRMFGGYIQFVFNRSTKKLVITRKMPFQGENPLTPVTETVLLHVDNTRPEIGLLNDPLVFPWIQDYALASVMLSIGNAREKYASIAGPGGGTTMNGGNLKSEAADLFAALEEDLKNYVDGSTPTSFIIG